MKSRSRKAQGFTLVEILIVVVILGILAAIVIPQFTSASETAKASSLTSQLQTIRSQLELYQVQHNGDYPSITAATDGTAWQKLTQTTNVSGNLSTTGTTYGPYLQKAPTNAFENSSAIVLTTSGTLGTPVAGKGWLYDSSTGEIKAVMAKQKAYDTNLLVSPATSSDDIKAY